VKKGDWVEVTSLIEDGAHLAYGRIVSIQGRFVSIEGYGSWPIRAVRKLGPLEILGLQSKEEIHGDDDEDTAAPTPPTPP